MSSTPKTQDLSGEVIASQFRLTRKIGAGGMGAVYLAEQLDMERLVVLKVLHPHLSAGDPDAVARFRQEAKAVARLNHPNIVQVHVFGQMPTGQLYLVMEFVDGVTLAELLSGGQPLEPLRALRVAEQICHALTEAHGRGIVHRDLKPENVMLSAHAGSPDHVKVLDFGIAKLAQEEGRESLTRDGAIFGTPRYMSPEQAQGLPVDLRADLYALGLVLYEMLTGQHPYPGSSALSYLLKHTQAQAVAPSHVAPRQHLSPQVDTLVMRCLEKAPEARFQSAADLRRQLREALRAQPEGRQFFPTPEAPAQSPNAFAATVPDVGSRSAEWTAPATTPDVPAQPSATTAPPAAPDVRVASTTPPTTRHRALLVVGATALVTALVTTAALLWSPKEDAPTTALTAVVQAPKPDTAPRDPITPQLSPDAAAKPPVVPQPPPERPPEVRPPPVGLPAAGAPWEGFPLPEKVVWELSTPQAIAYDTELPGKQVVAFYLHHLQHYRDVTTMATGLQIGDPRSPIAFVMLTRGMSGLLRLTLSRSPLYERPDTLPKPAFGVPPMPGAGEMVRTRTSVTFTVRATPAEAGAFYKAKLSDLPGVKSFESGQTILFNGAEADLRWKNVSIVPYTAKVNVTLITVTSNIDRLSPSADPRQPH